MPKQFTIAPYSLEEIGRSGNGRVAVKVHGYWSGDSATLYIQRKTDWQNSLSHLPFEQHPVKWEAQLSHASGGRDTKEEPSDLQASANFGAALIALATVGEQILAQAALLEKFAQEEMAKRRTEREAQKAAHAAAVEADAALGLDAAEQVMVAAKQHAREKGEAVVTAYHRGQDSFNKVVLTFHARSGITRVTFNGVQVPFKDATDMLAERSHRSTLVTE